MGFNSGFKGLIANMRDVLVSLWILLKWEWLTCCRHDW